MWENPFIFEKFVRNNKHKFLLSDAEPIDDGFTRYVYLNEERIFKIKYDHSHYFIRCYKEPISYREDIGIPVQWEMQSKINEISTHDGCIDKEFTKEQFALRRCALVFYELIWEAEKDERFPKDYIITQG